MQRLTPFALYLGLLSTAVGAVLKVGGGHVLGVGPKSFAALAGLCFLFSIAAEALTKRAGSP
ncbi:MAG: hypothetical protein HYY13_13935 [Nitrospirae bacterium]|nr:hypothetical protein [Nitrospirota bacterium]